MNNIQRILEHLDNGNLTDAKRLARPIKGAKLLAGILGEVGSDRPELAIAHFLYLHGELSWDAYCLAKRYADRKDT